MINSAFAVDVVIVGGGSAGAVIANRLGEDSGRRVLLLEAGHVYAPDAYPDVIANANRVGGDESHGWGYHTQDHLGLGHDVNAIRGKVLGGSSGVNAAIAMRGPSVRLRALDSDGGQGLVLGRIADLQGDGEHADGRRRLARSASQ